MVPRLRTMQVWERGRRRVAVAGGFALVIDRPTGRSRRISSKGIRRDMTERGYELVDQVRYRMSKHGRML
jgi:hypothetical protein